MDGAVALVHSHHLLDHKPDNLVLKGGKYKLRGVACLGRPGVALCVGSSANIEDFKTSLENAMPQKRFDCKILTVSCKEVSLKGFEAVSLGELRQILSSIGCESEFFELTGLDPEKAASSGGKASGKSKKNRKK